MKLFDRVRALERAFLRRVVTYPGDRDGFLSALGVNKEDYKRTNPDWSTGYDFLSALNDTARSDWD